MNTVAQKTDPDILTPAQRLGELLIVVAMLALLAFFANHLAANTGFFTTEFGPLEKLGLFGPILIAMAPPIVRAASGHRGSARLLEAIANFSLALGSFWLLIVFPFSYAHLADILPAALRFTLIWITDGVARVILIFQIIVASITALVLIGKYLVLLTRKPTVTA